MLFFLIFETFKFIKIFHASFSKILISDFWLLFFFAVVYLILKSGGKFRIQKCAKIVPNLPNFWNRQYFPSFWNVFPILFVSGPCLSMVFFGFKKSMTIDQYDMQSFRTRFSVVNLQKIIPLKNAEHENSYNLKLWAFKLVEFNFLFHNNIQKDTKY